MVLVAAAMLWERAAARSSWRPRCLAVLWLGLLGTVSQSSMVALLAGLAVIAAARFSLRVTAAVAARVVLAAGGRRDRARSGGCT